MTLKLKQVLTAAFICLGLSAAGAQAAPCMNDRGGVQTAEGKLEIGSFQDAAGRKETAFILTVQAPVCMDSDDADMRVKETRQIHVYSSQAALHKQLAGLKGRTVTVRGKVFGGHTSHHHAPIVMDVSKIDKD